MVKEITTEIEADDEDGGANVVFFVHNGQEELRIKAQDKCWAIQRFVTSTNKKTKQDESHWSSFKWVTDLGSVANRFYDMRLKRSEATSLKELSEAAFRIGEDIRKEFKAIKDKV